MANTSNAASTPAPAAPPKSDSKKEPGFIRQVVGAVNWAKLLVQLVPPVVFMFITWSIGTGSYKWLMSTTEWVSWVIHRGAKFDQADIALRTNGGIVAVLVLCSGVFLFAAGTLQAENKFVSILFKSVSGLVVLPWAFVMYDFYFHGRELDVMQRTLMMEIGWMIAILWIGAGNMVANLALSKTMRLD